MDSEKFNQLKLDLKRMFLPQRQLGMNQYEMQHFGMNQDEMQHKNDNQEKT